jgi:GTP cyclohydrolase I
MIARGVEKPGSTTCTSACLGLHATDAGRRTAFWRELEAKGGR